MPVRGTRGERRAVRRQVAECEKQEGLVRGWIASGAVNAQFGEFPEPVVGSVHGRYRLMAAGVCRAEQRSAGRRAEAPSAQAEVPSEWLT